MPQISKRKWAACKAEYENNGMTISALSSMFGVSRATISIRAKKEGWDRSNRIDTRNGSKLLASKKAENGTVLKKGQISKPLTDTEIAKSEFYQVLTNGTKEQAAHLVMERAACLLISHHYLLKRARRVGELMLRDLERRFDEDSDRYVDPNGDVPVYIATYDKLLEALERLMGMERSVFNIEDSPVAKLGNLRQNQPKIEDKSSDSDDDEACAEAIGVLVESGALEASAEISGQESADSGTIEILPS